MSRVVIITGMHRSGTSLVSSLLQRAGVHIGNKLIAANSANPRGYFADVDFYEFHEDLLHQRGHTYLHVDSDFQFQPIGPETERATQLVARRSDHPVWGWKDPRTSLFLSFWHQLLPDGRFLFVFRHPVDVLLSLLRRGEFDLHPTLMAGLDAWYAYNSKIETFFDAYPDRCLLVHIDGVVKQIESFAHLVREKLQLDSSPNSEMLAQTYHANELQKTPFSPELTATLVKLHPQLLALYARLNQKADLRGCEIQTDSAVPAGLSQVAHFAEVLAAPIKAPVKHSLLQLLLMSLAPESTAKMVDRFNLSAKQTQQKIDYLWMELQRLQRVNAEHDQELDSVRGVNAQQNSELERRSAQNTEQQQELARLGQINAGQQKELAALERHSTQQAQTLDNLQWLNLEHSQELERRSAQIASLEAELDGIYKTPVGKALRSYKNLRERWKKAA